MLQQSRRGHVRTAGWFVYANEMGILGFYSFIIVLVFLRVVSRM